MESTKGSVWSKLIRLFVVLVFVAWAAKISTGVQGTQGVAAWGRVAHAWSGNTKTQDDAPVLSERRLTLLAEGLRVQLRDFEKIPTTYARSRAGEEADLPAGAAPVSLARGDYDEDGIPDLLVGYATGRAGAVLLQPGNPDSIFPNSLRAQQRRREAQANAADHPTAPGGPQPSPFLREGRLFSVDQAPDFLGAGDFNADGHLDVLMAARGGRALTLLLGDGRGYLTPASAVRLPGTLTAFAVGEINRADGLADVVAGVETLKGPRVLVFEGPQGAFAGTPEQFTASSTISSLIVGPVDDDSYGDVAVGTHREFLVIHGRDRRLFLNAANRGEVPAPAVSQALLAIAVKDMALGRFTGNAPRELAMLADDGSVHVLSCTAGAARQDGQRELHVEPLTMQRRPLATMLLAANISGERLDDLILAEPASHQMHVLVARPAAALERLASTNAAAPRDQTRRVLSVDIAGEPLAVLSMRLNGDALSDLVILRSGQMQPEVLASEPAKTYEVTNTADSGPGSLRQAIIDANNHSGADLITFTITEPGPYTISLSSALPEINQPVTIDATAQGGYSGRPVIELAGAGLNAHGLDLAAGYTTVRGLVINRFQYNGILIRNTGGNIIEGNFIGTNLAGTASAGNGQSGVQIGFADPVTLHPGNSIGGTAPASRNVISGNGNNAVVDYSGDSVIEGNYIGTDVNGAFALANSFAAITVTGPNTTIRGNLISGNSGGGISIRYVQTGGNPPSLVSGATATLVQGNYIGTNAAGTGAIPNGNAAVMIERPAGFGTTSNTIGGTSPAARNIISGNQGVGIGLTGPGATGNVIQGNFVGTDVTGVVALANSGYGIQVALSAQNNVIGGTGAGEGNLISGNGSHGVSLSAGTQHNQILGNLVGTDVSGTQGLGNIQNGIDLTGTATQNLIGYNVLSGNLWRGLSLSVGAGQNNVEGNFIGTDRWGSAILPNEVGGIIVQQSPNNTIGGLLPSQRNIISGNGTPTRIVAGIFITNAAGTSIRNNYIGTNAAGTAALGNTGTGVLVSGGTNTFIGGPGYGNLISGNVEYGIRLGGGANNTRIQGNSIGTEVTGNSALGNGFGGVSIGTVFGAAANNTQVGGGAPGEANRIAFNGGAGITIGNTPSPSVGNLVRGNSISANAGLGIDLLPAGVTPNDPSDADTGANNQQNFPVLHSAIVSGAQTTVQGALNSSPNTTFTLEFFADASCDPTGFGEGATALLTSLLTTLTTPDSQFTVVLPAVPAGQFITATATDPLNNTSEFSQCVLVTNTPTGPNVTVTPSGSNAVTLSFANVTSGGLTTATPIDPATAGSLPDSFTAFGGLAYNITTTAQVSPPIDVCFNVAGVSDQALFDSLRIFHNEGGTLVDRTILPPNSPAPNFATGTLCARVSSLSPFVLARNLGAQAIKTSVLNQLRSLRATLSGKQELGKLDEAIDRLASSLAPALWIDQTHLDPKTGDRVFQDEKGAVGKLAELIKEKKTTIPDNVLMDCITRLIQADRILAQTIIADANLAHGDPAKIAKAREEMAQAEQDVASGKYDSGIEHFRNAWQQALKGIGR